MELISQGPRGLFLGEGANTIGGGGGGMTALREIFYLFRD